MTCRARPRARRFCCSTAALLTLLATGGADRTSVTMSQASAGHISRWRPPSAAVTVGPPFSEPLVSEPLVSELPLSPDIATTSPVPTSSSGIPTTVLSAYAGAADAQQLDDPTCHLAWPVLAAIGKVESNHANDGDVTTSGELLHPIFGPMLNGSAGTAAIPADNASDHSGQWARAEGPMQFLPTTWARWAADGNGDGTKDIQNVYDASLGAAHYLCSGNPDLTTSTGLTAAILRYNPSTHYLETVTYWLYIYSHGATAIPDQANTSGTLEDATTEQSPGFAAEPTQTSSGPPPPISSAPPPQPAQQLPALSLTPPSPVPVEEQHLVRPVTQLLNNVVQPIIAHILQ